jgi:hypothetical protein
MSYTTFLVFSLFIYYQFELNEYSFIARRILLKNKVYKIQDIEAIYFLHVRGANVKIKLKYIDKPKELLYNCTYEQLDSLVNTNEKYVAIKDARDLINKNIIDLIYPTCKNNNENYYIRVTKNSDNELEIIISFYYSKGNLNINKSISCRKVEYLR